MANEYDIGDKVRATVTFRNISDVLTDPTTIIIRTKTTADVEASFTYGVDAEVIKSSTGIYYMDITTTAAGNYFYRGVGTGTLVAAGESFFVVRASEFATP